MRRDAVKIQTQMFALVLRVEIELPPIPADATRAEALRKIRVLVKRPFDRPVVRQIELAPGRVVVLRGGRAAGFSSLGIKVRSFVARDDRKWNVAQMKPPRLIERKSLTHR